MAAGGLPRKRRLRRTWPQRLLLGFNVLVIVACLGTALGLRYAYGKLDQVARVPLPSGVLATTPTTVTRGQPAPENFLVYGTDNRECIDPASPWAKAFLSGYQGGDSQRTDTIMVLRADPANEQVAILSFPRDLYVPLAGTNGRKGRINEAIDGGPERLIRTITENFFVPIQHFVEVDFCAFKNLVDAMGGIGVPFAYPARDTRTGLGVVVPIGPGCHVMSGDEALAYARSRHYEYLDPRRNRWREDPSSDLGRIKRQQDLVKRLIQKAIDRGARNPVTLNRLVDAGLANVVIDTELTAQDVLDLGNAMRSLDPQTVQTYTIEATREIIAGRDVLVPVKNSLYNFAVALIFQGQGLPDTSPPSPTTTTDADATPTSTPPTTTARSTTSAPSPDTPATTLGPGATTTTTLPVIQVPTTLQYSVVPPPDLSCR